MNSFSITGFPFEYIDKHPVLVDWPNPSCRDYFIRVRHGASNNINRLQFPLGGQPGWRVLLFDTIVDIETVIDAARNFSCIRDVFFNDTVPDVAVILVGPRSWGELSKEHRLSREYENVLVN